MVEPTPRCECRITFKRGGTVSDGKWYEIEQCRLCKAAPRMLAIIEYYVGPCGFDVDAFEKAKQLLAELGAESRGSE